MVKVFFDLETNGFDRTYNDILQAAYAIFDGRKFIRGEVLHFYYDNMMETPQGAYDVNHLAKSDLVQYKDQFRQNCHRLYVALCGNNVVGFNNDNFDNNFAKLYLQRMKSPEVWFGNSYDVMKIAAPLAGGHRISLINLCKKFNFSEATINEKAKEYFGYTAAAHDAAYDVAATILCYFEEADRGMILDEPSLRKPEVTNKIDASEYNKFSEDLLASLYGEDTTPATPVYTTLPYEDGCMLCHTDDGYIPTCSDKSKYNGNILAEPIDGMLVASTVFIEDPINRGSYISIDNTQRLIVTDTCNLIEFINKNNR